jgi:hypothetical protein
MPIRPNEITRAEWNEIGALEAIRQSWGLEDDEDFADFALENIYGVKFDFHAGSPGYVGDLFILQGDALAGDPPFMLIRDQSGKLVLTD